MLGQRRIGKYGPTLDHQAVPHWLRYGSCAYSHICAPPPIEYLKIS